MQGRAVPQETSVLTIALFTTGCVTLGYLLGSSCLSFVSDKRGPDPVSSKGEGIRSLQPKASPIFWESIFHSLFEQLW